MTFKEMQTAEAAKHAPLLQAAAGGVAQGQNPFAQGGPYYNPTPVGRPVPLGWTARYGIDDEDDYDSDLQAALAASVTEQHANKATDLTRLVPGEDVCPLLEPANA